jgi:hypothetical protein
LEDTELLAGTSFFEQEASEDRHNVPTAISFSRLVFLDIRSPFPYYEKNLTKRRYFFLIFFKSLYAISSK